MTKVELDKCEKLCLKALRDIKESEELYKEAEVIDKDLNISSVQLRRADNKRGYAEGINQVLATIGYKSENMTKLSKLI